MPPTPALLPAPADPRLDDSTPTLADLATRRRGSSPRGPHRFEALCARLDNPRTRLDPVHVVGTDGKTSVTRLLSSMLVAADVRVGETTSPHLEHVRERIRLDGRPLPDARLEAVAARLTRPIAEVDRLGEPVTFFEAVTAAALVAFAEAEVDVAIVEAGIGGSGDATGRLAARTVVLTTVGADHPELGASLAEIAREKAGVVAPGGTLVSAPQTAEVRDAVRDVARQRGARLLWAGEDFDVAARRTTSDGQWVELRAPDGARVQARLGVHGAHQAVNAAVALAALHAHLGGLPDPRRLRAGLEVVRIPGRLEIVERPGRALLVLDGAHDATAARALDAALREVAGDRRRVLVAGVGGGRDPLAVLAPLLRAGTRVIATTVDPSSVSTLGPLVQRLEAADVPVTAVAPPSAALATAELEADEDTVVVVTGSLYLVGALARRARRDPTTPARQPARNGHGSPR
jgi:dihydrofolate synthase / folylpolyglutamate synthase